MAIGITGRAAGTISPVIGIVVNQSD